MWVTVVMSISAPAGGSFRRKAKEMEETLSGVAWLPLALTRDKALEHSGVCCCSSPKCTMPAVTNIFRANPRTFCHRLLSSILSATACGMAQRRKSCGHSVRSRANGLSGAQNPWLEAFPLPLSKHPAAMSRHVTAEPSQPQSRRSNANLQGASRLLS